MKDIDIAEWSAKPFAEFDKGWFLLTGGDFSSKWNTMTVSWGFAGTMWGKPVVAVVVRPGRYTREFLDANPEFTLSAFPEECKKALTILGTKSGRDCDKVALSGLTPVPANIVKAPAFAEADTVLECRALYRQPMTRGSFLDSAPFEKWYSSEDDLHIAYIAEVLALRRRQ
ncbi:MAG: flavin reductase [Kiritimatiellae bacterium]|nr:flavin reductase [Kiritimatiellia bacterium]